MKATTIAGSLLFLIYPCFALQRVEVKSDIKCGQSGKTYYNGEKYPKPWTVIITHDENERFMCLGSIIQPKPLNNSQHIVTTGACYIKDLLKNKEAIPVMNVYAGVSRWPTARGVRVGVRKAYTFAYWHEDKSFFGGLALLELEEALFFEEHIQPVCLPAIDSSIPEDSHCAMSSVTGAVHTFVERSVYDVEECDKDKYPILKGLSALCAPKHEHITNQELGSPLYCNNPESNTWYLHGVLLKWISQNYKKGISSSKKLTTESSDDVEMVFADVSKTSKLYNAVENGKFPSHVDATLCSGNRVKNFCLYLFKGLV
ncbi:Prostasin [Trichinella spiralis]|uniref:Prostasin n=1 Tax=Trichinella spiralis TaxID=6334 RepID=A0ABR3KAA5_TRISP